MPAGLLTVWEREYPYAWLGILADVPPSTDELIYAWHPEGFALHSMRSASVSRFYLQVPNDTSLDDWDLTITGEVDGLRRWSWDEFRALPSEPVTVDIHCVTKWSKLDSEWEGVSLDTLLEGVDTSAQYVVAFCDGGYTTNLPLEDLTESKAWIAFAYDGEPLDPAVAKAVEELIMPQLQGMIRTVSHLVEVENG